MIGAALRATTAAIPAATMAPTSKYQGRSERPSTAGAGSRMAGDAGLIASRGRAKDTAGPSSLRTPLVRGSERGAGTTVRAAGASASAVRRDSRTRPSGAEGRRAGASIDGFRASAGRTCRPGIGDRLGAGRGAVETGCAIVGCGGTTSPSGSATPAGVGTAVGAGSTAVTTDASSAATAGAGAGSGDDTGAGSVAAGAGRTGSSKTGSTYPFASAAMRTPRWTCEAVVTASSLSPTWPTTAPSATELPRATATEPSWSSVTA
jgi:hypothetical protein